jgi:hypothetical protein
VLFRAVFYMLLFAPAFAQARVQLSAGEHAELSATVTQKDPRIRRARIVAERADARLEHWETEPLPQFSEAYEVTR